MSAADQTRWFLAWHERPTEEAAHFNPAFCGELIALAITDYAKMRAAPFPLALAFLVLPLALTPGFRAGLPRRADTAFASWAAENADLLTTVPERVMRLRPVSREALLFTIRVGGLAMSRDGVMVGPTPLRFSDKRVSTTDETQEIRRAAALLGRWFAAQGSVAAILQVMGVRV